MREYTLRFDEIDRRAELLVSTPASGRRRSNKSTASCAALSRAPTGWKSFPRASARAGCSSRKAMGVSSVPGSTPLDRVGLYLPGGKASYPSSVMMNAILPGRQSAGNHHTIVRRPGPPMRCTPAVRAVREHGSSASEGARRSPRSTTEPRRYAAHEQQPPSDRLSARSRRHDCSSSSSPTQLLVQHIWRPIVRSGRGLLVCASPPDTALADTLPAALQSALTAPRADIAGDDQRGTDS